MLDLYLLYIKIYINIFFIFCTQTTWKREKVMHISGPTNLPPKSWAKKFNNMQMRRQGWHFSALAIKKNPNNAREFKKWCNNRNDKGAEAKIAVEQVWKRMGEGMEGEEMEGEEMEDEEMEGEEMGDEETTKGPSKLKFSNMCKNAQMAEITEEGGPSVQTGDRNVREDVNFLACQIEELKETPGDPKLVQAVKRLKDIHENCRPYLEWVSFKEDTTQAVQAYDAYKDFISYFRANTSTW